MLKDSERRSFVWNIKRLFARLSSFFLYICLRLISSRISFPFMWRCKVALLMRWIICPHSDYISVHFSMRICVRDCINSKKNKQKKFAALPMFWRGENISSRKLIVTRQRVIEKFSTNKLEKWIWTFNCEWHDDLLCLRPSPIYL